MNKPLQSLHTCLLHHCVFALISPHFFAQGLVCHSQIIILISFYNYYYFQLFSERSLFVYACGAAHCSVPIHDMRCRSQRSLRKKRRGRYWT